MGASTPVLNIPVKLQVPLQIGFVGVARNACHYYGLAFEPDSSKTDQA